MAAPLVDFTPVLKVIIPFMIVAAAAGFLVNAIAPERRRRRPRRYSSDPPLMDVIAGLIAGWIRRRRAFRPSSQSPSNAASANSDSVGISVPDLSPPPALESPTLTAGPTLVRSGWTVANIQKLEWKRFELLTTEFLKALGFDARMTRVGADGGVDVRLYRAGRDEPVGMAQCKAWNTYKVGIKPVRELYGVMAAEHVEQGLFVTTSTFTEEALEFAKGKKLELVDGDALISFIRQLPLDRKTTLLDSTFSGDYSTPTCPNCDIKMVSRTALKGTTPGSTFWGCPRYPRCKHTFRMRET